MRRPVISLTRIVSSGGLGSAAGSFIGSGSPATISLAMDDPDNPFRHALDRWCGGRPDEKTLALIDAGR